MRWLQSQWYRRKNIWAYCLSPLASIYHGIVLLRYFFYRCGLKKTTQFPVPIIVVGNITVGGTGKTPLVAWLVNWLAEQGLKPGIVSRGYCGRATSWPQCVTKHSDPYQVGDEAVMLAEQTDCPIVVGPKRVAAVQTLLTDYDCNVVVSDDGLQHYALGRDIEIALIDGMRRYGNGFCLPAGPLRESIRRLHRVDFVVVNGCAGPNEYALRLIPGAIYNINNPARIFDPKKAKYNTLHAVAGIGYPQRFFRQLIALGLTIIPHPFPDHYAYKPQDLEFGDNAEVIMTTKDAVKCRSFAHANCWCLPVSVQVDEALVQRLRHQFATASCAGKASR